MPAWQAHMRFITVPGKRVLLPAAATVLWLLAAGVACWAAESAQETEKAEEPPILYRKVYVPSDQISELQGVYYSMERKLFDQAIETIRAKEVASGTTLDARIARASYSGRLVGDELVDGTAELTIIHSTGTPTVVAIAPCGLALEQFAWRPFDSGETSEDTTDGVIAAKVGLDDVGSTVAVVKTSGVLQFNWSLRGRRETSEELTFALELPACPMNHLELDIPDGHKPTVQNGIVSQGKSSASDDAYRRWSIDLGRNASTNLRIASSDDEANVQQSVLLRQHTTYRFAELGLEVVVDLRLDVQNQPLSQLTVALDEPLQLIDASYGETRLSWTESASPSGRKLVLELPEPVLGVDRLVRLRAVAPIKMASGWKLPCVAAEGVLWLEGGATLEVPSPLALEDLVVASGRQTKVAPMPAQDEGEAIQIQYFGPNAKVQAVVRPREGEITVAQGTTVKLGPATASAVQVADFESTGRPRFVLEMETSSYWTIDLIETDPPDLIEEWAITGNRVIQLRLREALTPERPFGVTVRGHNRGVRRSNLLDGDDLRFAVFRDVKATRSLVVVGAESPYQVQLAGDAELTRVASSELTEQERERLTWPTHGVAYVDGPVADGLTVALRDAPLSYAADIRIQSDVGGTKVDHTFRIRCTPKSSSVDRLLIHFSEPSAEDLRWQLGEDKESRPIARRMTPEEQQQAGVHGGETWEVALPNRQEAQFELVARRSEPFEAELSIPLVSLAGASPQVGTVTIRSLEAIPIIVKQVKLKPVPPAPTSPRDYATTHGVFRYEPSQEGRVSIVRRAPDTQRRRAWIWSCRLVSRFMDDGKAVHEVAYHIENTGATQLDLKPPEDCEFLEASVDGHEVPLPADVAATTNLVIPLPRGVRFPTALIRLATKREPLRPLCTVSAPWPEPNLSVFRREWFVWLPPGFDRLDDTSTRAKGGWRRRLFGPLLRSEDRQRFDPLSGDHWRSLGTEADAQQAQRSNQIEMFLHEMARQVPSLEEATDRQTNVTWGELLAACERSRHGAEGKPSSTVWVDQHRLAQVGITAETPVDWPTPITPTSENGLTLATQRPGRATELLEYNNLAVISHEYGTLLTTGDELTHPVSDATELRIVPVTAWTAQPRLPQTCWSAIPNQPNSSVVDDGWTVHAVPISDHCLAEVNGNRISRLRIQQPQAVQALAWAALLATAGLVWWLMRRRILLGVPLAAIAGIAALLGPDDFLPILTCCFLGTLLAACFATVFPAGKRRDDEKSESDAGSGVSSVLTETAAVGLIAVIALGSAQGAHAQEGAAPESAVPAEIHRVHFPVDAEGKPVGEDVFVPPAFYDVLRREGSAGGLHERKWMILRADYRAVFRWDVAADELAATELVAKYELEVSQPNTSILLPVEQEQVHLLSNRAQANGQPASVSWLPGGKGLSVEVAQPGTCELELAFRPNIERKKRDLGFQLGIPPLPCSQLKVELPAQASGVEFPTAFGTVTHDDETGFEVVRLGPTDRLVVRWPIDPNENIAPSALTVEQLTWLSVRPGAVVIDAKFKFSTLSGTIGRVQLRTDPRLTILPPAPDQPIAAWRAATDKDVQTIWLDIEPPFEQEVAFDTSFVLAGTSGIGNVRVPRLEAVADRTNRHWLAVSVADDLDFKQPKPIADASPNEADFIAAWGPTEEPPQVVAGLSEGQPDWVLATWPREPIVTAAQRLAVSIGQHKADVKLDADIEITGGKRFQYRILASRLLEITSVSAVESEAERATKWSRDNAGAVIVRLDGPVTRSHRLQLSGTIPLRRSNGNYRFPRISLADVELTTDRVDLYRRSEVLVDVTDKGALADVGGAELGRHRKGWGRLVAALQASAGISKPAAIQVDLRPNRPRTDARLVIAMDRRDGDWQAEADCDVQAASGIIDAIRLDIPEEWKGPFDVEPEAQVEIVDVPDQTRRHLLVRPPQAVKSNYRVRVRGTLAASAGERVRAPDIVPLDVVRADRYLVAPTKVQRQQIAWETSGLQATRLPSGYETELESYVAYAVQDRRNRFQATIRDVQAESGAASVHLADIHVDCNDDGCILGLATFDLEPAGLSACELVLPAGYELLHVMVGDLPAQLDRMKGHRWRFRLGPRQLPQQVQVVFTGMLKPTQWQQRTAVVQAPTLAGIAVEQTLWTVRGPTTGDIEIVAGESQLDPLPHELFRLEKTAALVETASDVLAERDPDDISHWYLAWSRRLAASRSRAAQWQLAYPARGSEEAALRIIDTKQAEIAMRLGTGELKALSESECSQITQPVDVWRLALNRSAPIRRCAFSGSREAIEFRHRIQANSIATEPWVAVTVLLGIALVSFVVLPHPALEYCFHRCPQLLGIPLGIAWWLWFAPSLLGLIVLILAALASIRPMLRTLTGR